MHSDLLLVLVVGTALAFDFTNGFHDTANVVATSISTRALPPRVAIGMASLLNFAGAFISLAVAATVAKGIVDPSVVALQPAIVFSGLIGAISWNVVTWYYGLPSSSSHALIGGVVGAAFAANGSSGVMGDGLVGKVVVPAIVAPILAFVGAGFRFGQVISGGMLALAHGTNDAQKTIGVIVLALVSHGDISPNHIHVPSWVVITAASAIALGTYAGGWRIIRTLGSRIIKMDPAQGFAAQGSGAAVILAASHVGYPLSTTHTISGAVMGAGAAKRLSAVRWGVAGNIVAAWLLTLPASAGIGAAVYGATRIFGVNSEAGPVIVAVLILIGTMLAFGRRLRRGSPLTAPQA